MVSTDKYFDKFVCREEEKDKMAVEENKNREVVLLFWFKLEKFESLKN